MTSALPVFGMQPPLDPHRLVREILAQRRFRVWVPAAHWTWWDRFARWLGDRWEQLARALGQHVHLAPAFGVAIGDLLIVAVAALVLFVVARILVAHAAERSSPDGSPWQPAHVVTAHALYAQSVRASQSGDHAAAVALLFRAALARLDVQGVVHDQPSHTVEECRRQVRRRSDQVRGPFDTLARVFTAALYADAPITAAQWTAAAAAYAQLARACDDGV